MKYRDEFILESSLKRPSITNASMDLLLGKYISSGQYRDVFEYYLDKNYVVKVEKDDTNGFYNVKEFEMWCLVKDYENNTKDWFADVKAISENGKILIQKRTFEKDKEPPKEVPQFFTDLKLENFGWIGNRFVCHDYADCLVRLGYFGFKDKMQKANWWK